MSNYQKFNNIGGWLIFAVASLVYFLTIEPTTSWWDCGEYIATAYKLQVGHPPGAPLFQMIGRFFSLFAFGNEANVALMINIMSALSSSFTILFLFWTISLLGKKMVKARGEMNDAKMFMVLGSACVGALAYTFSDSFWFSAVEGEVYAMSSFFTALVFWAILKWEENADKASNMRWLILIAYLMGLSIGVHLLNLLAIPAIAFVYYYKKYDTSRKGIIITLIVSVLVLAGIMYVLIPWIVKLSSLFELLFVNSFGLPFNTGTIFYFLLLIGGIVWGIRYTIKKQKVLLNTLIICFVFILIGYSSFFMLVIRSNADVPIDENSPEEAISLLSYLNREQYGSWPLFHGQYYNAPVVGYEDGANVYEKDKKLGKYVVVSKKTIYTYDPKFTTIFPRIWSNQKPIHALKYKEYITGTTVRTQGPDGKAKVLVKPTFGDNLKFFFSYQVGHMYFRYFMWNFAGRQNDIESQGDPREGNWISGISFLDNARLGDLDLLPDAYRNEATNKFYLLPLILGFIGFFFHFQRSSKDTWVVSLLFLMTGLAIVVFLNQYPFQPRERDYAYAGSFYAFAIWIGLGVMAITDFMNKYSKNAKLNAIAITAICFFSVPVLMASQGWDDHDRSGKYAARDWAKNYMDSCDPNAVLYSIGDNDTFPLWYIQEVENHRTDIRVVNYMLSSGEWYVNQLSKKVYEAEPLPFSILPEQYGKGKNEYTPYYEGNFQVEEEYVELKNIIDFIASDHPASKVSMASGTKMNFFPFKKVKIKVDSAACVDNGIVPRELAHLIVDEITWEIKSDALYKNDLAFLDFLANNNWERPIYFTNPSVVKDVFQANDFVYLSGFTYKLMPIRAQDFVDELGGIDTEQSYNILMNVAKYGNLKNSTFDRESTRNSSIVKQSFMRLARALLQEGDKEKALKVVEKCFEEFPIDKMPIDHFSRPFIDIYYKCGAVDKALALSEALVKRYAQEFDYYLAYPSENANAFDNEMREALTVIQHIAHMANENGQTEYVKEIEALFQSKLELYQ
jgi:hypothetical protein